VIKLYLLKNIGTQTRSRTWMHLMNRARQTAENRGHRIRVTGQRDPASSGWVYSVECAGPCIVCQEARENRR
jgi:hypothetical protein